MRCCLPFFLVAVGAFAQSGNLPSQVNLIMELMPNATRFAIFYNPERADIDRDIESITQQTGLLVVKFPVTSLREISKKVRSLDQYGVNFIFLVEDNIVTGSAAIRFVVKPNVKDKIPVFTTDTNGFRSGALGLLYQDSGAWLMRINGGVVGRYDIEIPESQKFLVEGGVPD